MKRSLFIAGVALALVTSARAAETNPAVIPVPRDPRWVTRHQNFVEIAKNCVDAWGIPSLKIHCAFGENEFALRKDMSLTGAEMLSAAGAQSIQPFRDSDPPGFSIHEMGTARMGRDPKTSVLNSWNQSHDIKNLFITDGACMASSGCVNPSLTYMALTARACDYAVNQLKRGEL